MRSKILRLVPRTDVDFTNIPVGLTLSPVPIAQDVDLTEWGSATLLVRIHKWVSFGGGVLRFDARAVAPTDEDPATFFREAVVGTLTIGDPGANGANGVLFHTRLASNAGGAMSLFLSCTKFPAQLPTFQCTYSVDLVLQERADGWSPAELGSRLTLWLDQRDLAQVSLAYSAWGDQSPGGASDFSQATSTLRPLVGAKTNFQPAPSFDGTDDTLGGPALSALVSASAYHVFAVFRVDTVTGVNATPYFNNGVIADTVAGWWGLYLKNNAGTLEAHGFHWAAAQREAIATGLALGTDVLVEWSYDGTTIRCQIGHGAIATGTGGGAIGSLVNPVRLGTGATGSLYFDGALASVVVCNAYLSQAEARNVREYLSSKYGVSA